MKILKNILIAVVVIVFIAAVGIYFLPNHYTVSRSIEINKPADVVYAQLSDFGKWGAWSPWQEMEPEAKVTLDGTPAQPGHKMSWDGKKLGKGDMTIVSATANKAVSSDLEFISPFQMKAKDYFQLEAMGDKTKVTWTDAGGLKYPMGRLFGLTMDKMLGGQYEHGLQNLKKVCEAIPAPVATSDTTIITTASN